MPLYEYQCERCGHRFERIQKFSDPPVELCPLDQGPVKKLLSSPAIQFKGSGWYVTDYAKKPADESKPAAKESSSEGSAGAASTTTPAAPKEGTSSTPAAKSESKESKKE